MVSSDCGLFMVAVAKLISYGKRDGLWDVITPFVVSTTRKIVYKTFNC